MPLYIYTQPYEEVYQPEHKYIFTISCIRCNNEHEVTFKDTEMFALSQQHIQEAVPDMSKEMREMCISGICPTCWNEVFPPDEDDDEPFGDTDGDPIQQIL